MGWDQENCKAGKLDLLEKITGASALSMLEAKLAEQGLSIIKQENITLSTDYYGYEYKGERITLSDGRVFEHKLSRTQSSDDWGSDYYGWFLSTEKPVVEHVSLLDDTVQEDAQD